MNNFALAVSFVTCSVDTVISDINKDTDSSD